MADSPGGGGEKTEKATPKKLQDARERGQAFQSKDLSTAFTMIVMFGTLKFISSFLITRVTEFLSILLSFDYLSTGNIDKNAAGRVLMMACLQFWYTVAPIMGAAFISGLVINYIQVGFLFSTKPLEPKLSNLDPIKGFKNRMFSIRNLIELIKSILKLVVLTMVVYNALKDKLSVFANLMQYSIKDAVSEIVDIIMNVAFQSCIAFSVIAVFDLIFQWWKHQQDMMMTKQEVKEEMKLLEGRPETKNRIRKKQQELGMMRMMQAVPGADAVITNPTHYAVAIRYSDKEVEANLPPVVVAMGQDFLAQRIKEIAAENDVPVVEHKPLARALFAVCEVGMPIPNDIKLYEAVAEILQYVYQLKNKTVSF